MYLAPLLPIFALRQIHPFPGPRESQRQRLRDCKGESLKTYVKFYVTTLVLHDYVG